MKNYFYHNHKYIKTSKTLNTSQTDLVDKKIRVDINTLLNRVKVNEKKKKNSQIIFFSTVTLILIAIGLILTYIR
jgi:uncharacterized membrane protein YqjE